MQINHNNLSNKLLRNHSINQKNYFLSCPSVCASLRQFACLRRFHSETKTGRLSVKAFEWHCLQEIVCDDDVASARVTPCWRIIWQRTQVPSVPGTRCLFRVLKNWVRQSTLVCSLQYILWPFYCMSYLPYSVTDHLSNTLSLALHCLLLIQKFLNRLSLYFMYISLVRKSSVS